MPILGTDANDLLEGIPGADDIIYGGDGDDTLRGGQGDDVLEGGAGADEIDGGEDGGLPLLTTTFRGSIWGDTATYEHSDAGVTIDLAMGTAQGGHAEGDTLTGIESVRASDHADMLVARPEGSTLYGQRGNDTLNGGTGVDYLWGGKGDDVLMGGADSDYLEGGFGADVIDGGDGFDIAGYELSDAGVTIDLATGTAQGGHAEGDTLTGIEFIVGSSYADRLTGDARFNILLGGPGADMLDGGEGFAQANYYYSDAGVTVNLATGTAQGGHAEGDTLTGIVQVAGSFLHADHITGDDGGNNLSGFGGNDTLEGGAGSDFLRGGPGADMLIGGAGDDTARYLGSDVGVTVNLATGTAQGGHAEGDTLTGIEAVDGSVHANHLTGDDGNNYIVGREGNDTLAGAAGDDYLYGGAGADMLDGGEGDDELDGAAGDDELDGGAGDDTLYGGAGADMLDGGEGDDSANYGGSDAGVTVNLATGTGQGGDAVGDALTGFENVDGSDHADHLTGDDRDNGLHGGAGADTLDGGEGDDHVGYWGSDAGVTVNLATGTGQGGDAEGDTLTGIENLIGSDHADLLIGNTARNLIMGGKGDDWDDPTTAAIEGGLFGGNGFDEIHGGDGNDYIVGSPPDPNPATPDSHDTLYGGKGDDLIINGSAGWDRPWIDSGTPNRRLVGVTADDVTKPGDPYLLGDGALDLSNEQDLNAKNVINGGLFGGDGNDTLISGVGPDFLDGGSGSDTVSYEDSDGAVTVDLAATRTHGTAIGGDASIPEVQLTIIEDPNDDSDFDHLSDAIEILVGIENVIGSAENDSITGDSLSNMLNGGGGNDTLEGAAGNDWLDGGAGADLLTGGEDADTFVFGDGDTVTDFEDGSDLINIDDFGHITTDNFATNVTIRQSGSDVEVQIGDAVLTLNGVSGADLTVDDFILA